MRINVSPLLESHSGNRVEAYRTTFSIIENGNESHVLNDDGDVLTMFLLTDSFDDDPMTSPSGDDNRLTGPDSYSLSWDQLSNHDGDAGWENTIRVTDHGVFVHPAGDAIIDLAGCKTLCDDPSNFSFRGTQQNLQTVRDIYNNANLDGPNNFILTPNSPAAMTVGERRQQILRKALGL